MGFVILACYVVNKIKLSKLNTVIKYLELSYFNNVVVAFHLEFVYKILKVNVMHMRNLLTTFHFH